MEEAVGDHPIPVARKFSFTDDHSKPTVFDGDHPLRVKPRTKEIIQMKCVTTTRRPALARSATRAVREASAPDGIASLYGAAARPDFVMGPDGDYVDGYTLDEVFAKLGEEEPERAVAMEGYTVTKITELDEYRRLRNLRLQSQSPNVAKAAKARARRLSSSRTLRTSSPSKRSIGSRSRSPRRRRRSSVGDGEVDDDEDVETEEEEEESMLSFGAGENKFREPLPAPPSTASSASIRVERGFFKHDWRLRPEVNNHRPEKEHLDELDGKERHRHLIIQDLRLRLQGVIDLAQRENDFDESREITFEKRARGLISFYLTNADQAYKAVMMDLRHVPLGTFETEAVSYCLVQDKNAHLQYLRVSGGRLKDSEAMSLLMAIEEAKNLTSVDLSNNSLGPRVCEAFASLFGLSEQSTTNLTSVDLSGNPLGDRGVEVLCRSLKFDRRVKTLRLSRVGATERGTLGMGELLHENICLEEVDFSWNMAGLEGGKALAEGLSNSPSLKTLTLTHLGLGDVGGAHIANALGTNSVLSTIDLAHNGLRGGMCTVLASVLLKARVFEIILDNNALGYFGMRQLLAAFCNPECFTGRISAHDAVLVDLNLGHEVVVGFDERDPNKMYKLDLANPVQRQVAWELATRWASGDALWAMATYMDRPLRIRKELEWPERLPDRGELVVDFVSLARVPDNARPLSRNRFQCAWNEDVIAAPDHWRISYVRCMASAVYVNSFQAARMVQSFSWPAGREHAVMLIFGKLCDPHNVQRLWAHLPPNEQQVLLTNLGILQVFNPQNPTGRYGFNMSRHLDYAIAKRLLDQYNEELRDKRVDLAAGQWCWRNVSIDGVVIPTEEIDPGTFQLPVKGELRFDYVSYHLVGDTQGRVVKKPITRVKFAWLLKRLSQRPTPTPWELYNDFTRVGGQGAITGEVIMDAFKEAAHLLSPREEAVETPPPSPAVVKPKKKGG
eukprot:CAMPEP_0182883292 /NCGR_PEP_ID=MMETSP0034_2-20130328/18294_1 /TAXON_ID=156128 /ORGANISM="Nephroselmis pyriformis, Strain CCMP717" /LENGTH=955 /DNA_ID=CAMNT_0025016429 /DNA_START=233 /DNA_END=3096 /DNA_ORIENTATION=+